VFYISVVDVRDHTSERSHVVLMLDDGSQETKTAETTPRTYSLLRPSAFSVPAATTSAGRLFINLFIYYTIVHRV